uniref:Formin 1 n=1 Tax=Kryptolebias marmoratus TaxID=37003 RepID=A0A3Q2ZDV6_KRYMA
MTRAVTIAYAGTDKSVFPLPEPQDFLQASQVNFDDLAKDIRKLKKDLTACEKDVENVCGNSSDEHLQPFKEKMDLTETFLDMVSYFGMKPKSGEKEVASSYVFMLWYEFCNDFKNSWIRQTVLQVLHLFLFICKKIGSLLYGVKICAVKVKI